MTSPLADASADARRAAAASLGEIIERLRGLSSNPGTANLLHFFEAERARTLATDAQDESAVAVAEHDSVDGAADPTPVAVTIGDSDQVPLSSVAHVARDEIVVDANATAVDTNASASAAAVANPDIVNTDSTADLHADDVKKPSQGTEEVAVGTADLTQAAPVINQQEQGPSDPTNVPPPTTAAVPLEESDVAPAAVTPLQSDRDYVTLRQFVDLLGAMPRDLATKYGATFSLVALAFHVKTISPWIDFAQHTKATHICPIPHVAIGVIPAFNVVNISTGGKGDVTVGSLHDALAPLAAANGSAAVCVGTRALHTRVAVSFDIDEAVNYQDTTLNPMRSDDVKKSIGDAIDLARRCIAAGMSAREVLGMLTRRVPASADFGPLMLVRLDTQLVTAAELFECMGRCGFSTLPALKHIFADVTLQDDSARGPGAVFMAETDVSLGVLLHAIQEGDDAMAALPRHDEPCSEFYLAARRLGAL
ncbi:hypothetical protein pqer_cds_539 [Pandoravirus quercus]|nr:hypothetical protein pqer_cds_539 [Pandoravirus quercus]AVK74961.1 hypothetical protein pqer_cds_539 [Pandoravirus quercus]